MASVRKIKKGVHGNFFTFVWQIICFVTHPPGAGEEIGGRQLAVAVEKFGGAFNSSRGLHEKQLAGGGFHMEHAHVKSRVKIHGRLIDPEKIKSPSGQQGPFRLPEKSLDTAVVSSQVPSELRLLNESVDVMWAAVYRLREGLSSIAGPSGSDQVGLAPQKLSGVITHLADEIWAVRGRVNVLVRELRALIDGCQL